MGTVAISEVNASRAVQEYDPDLILGRNEGTEEWQVFVKEGPYGRPFPVFTIGRDLPPYDRIQQMLYAADVRRHGARIVADVQRRYEEHKRREDSEWLARAEDVAEDVVVGMTKLGMLPKRKFYVPSQKGK